MLGTEHNRGQAGADFLLAQSVDSCRLSVAVMSGDHTEWNNARLDLHLVHLASLTRCMWNVVAGVMNKNGGKWFGGGKNGSTFIYIHWHFFCMKFNIFLFFKFQINNKKLNGTKSNVSINLSFYCNICIWINNGSRLLYVYSLSAFKSAWGIFCST